MTPQEFAEWRHDAVHSLIDLNEQCDREFRLDQWPRWQCELDSAKLVFLDQDLPRVTASILVAGTSSTEKREWRWGWANESLPRPAVDRMREVRQFGETRGLAELTRETLPADEHLGWEMTALAARVLGAKGAFRCPNKEGFTYLLYTDIALAPQPDARRPEVQCLAHGRGLSTYVCEHLVANPAAGLVFRRALRGRAMAGCLVLAMRAHLPGSGRMERTVRWTDSDQAGLPPVLRIAAAQVHPGVNSGPRLLPGDNPRPRGPASPPIARPPRSSLPLCARV